MPSLCDLPAGPEPGFRPAITVFGDPAASDLAQF